MKIRVKNCTYTYNTTLCQTIKLLINFYFKINFKTFINKYLKCITEIKTLT